MRSTKVFFLTAALAVSMAFAQAPANPPKGNHAQHRVDFLTTLLNLTSAQQQQATTIFTSAAANETALHSNFKNAHESLATAIHNNDNAGIEQLSTSIGNLTAQMTVAQAKADAAFYQILTADQQTKLTQFESQNHGHWGAGPGGFAGRPH